MAESTPQLVDPLAVAELAHAAVRDAAVAQLAAITAIPNRMSDVREPALACQEEARYRCVKP